MDDNLELLLAMQDDAFKEILANDPVLDELQNQKNNRFEEYVQLMQIFSGEVCLNGVKFGALTLAIWCFLYSIRSPFTTGGKPGKLDVDIFAFLLHHGTSGVSENLFEEASGFCEKNKIEYKDAEDFIYRTILISFRAMQMVQFGGGEGEKAQYNLDWLTAVIKQVSKCTNEKRSFILYEMPLVEVFYYVVQCMRETDTNHQIRRENSAEIVAKIYQRTFELGKKYFEQNYKNK